jgi:hypothetical protein
MGAFSRRLRGGGIELLLPERGRRCTAYLEAARCRPILVMIACVQLLLTIRHRGGALCPVLDCRRARVAPRERDNVGCRRSANSVVLGPERGGNRGSWLDRTYGRGSPCA